MITSLLNRTNDSGLSRLASTDQVDSIAAALLNAIEAKDARIRHHSERVAKYVLQMAGQLQLPDAERRVLRYGGLLHDVGNIGIPDSILLNPGGLTDWEFEEVRMHPYIGEQICKPLQSLTDVLPLIRNHHEKLDGSGYPDGLAGDDIPFPVRLLSVVDVYDTLRSERVYRSAFGHAEAIAILLEEATRGWWQPDIVMLLAGIMAPREDFAPV